jgi:hypothetical protein
MYPASHNWISVNTQLTSLTGNLAYPDTSSSPVYIQLHETKKKNTRDLDVAWPRIKSTSFSLHVRRSSSFSTAVNLIPHMSSQSENQTNFIHLKEQFQLVAYAGIERLLKNSPSQ